MNVNINYCNENTWSEKWKEDYRYGIILFIPPEPVKSFVDNLRYKYDPVSYKSCVAHISLTMPIKHPITDEDINSIKSDLLKFKQFKVKYGPVINFLPVAPGVVFNVQEQEFFRDLYKHIESTPGIDFYPRKWPFKAHLTIAEFLNDLDTASLTTELNKSLKDKRYGEFLCTNVSYMIPDKDFIFREVYTFNLGI